MGLGKAAELPHPSTADLLLLSPALVFPAWLLYEAASPHFLFTKPEAGWPLLTVGGEGSILGPAILVGVKKGRSLWTKHRHLLSIHNSSKEESPAPSLPERTVFKQAALASCHGARATAAAATIVVIMGVAREALASS